MPGRFEGSIYVYSCFGCRYVPGIDARTDESLQQTTEKAKEVRKCKSG